MSCRDYYIDLMSAVLQTADDFAATRKSSAPGQERTIPGSRGAPRVWLIAPTLGAGSLGPFRCLWVQAELLPFLRRIYRRMAMTGDTAEAVMIVQQ
jgi:hypothetical protein